MKESVKQNIRALKPYIPGKPIEEVRREFGLKKVIKLASNENCLGPSPKAVNSLKKYLNNINRYPDGAAFYLKKKLASFLGVKEQNLIIGNGSDEIIVTALRTFVSASDEVVIAKPTFLIYEIASQIQGARIRYIPLTQDLRYDLAAMKRALTPNTKMVFIANPDNPTGTYVTKKEMDDFFRDIPEDVIVFLDEAYFEFAGHDFKDYPDGIDYLMRPNVIVSRSFSKAYGLAGMRIGYGISNPSLINYMERVRDPFNVNLLSQVSAIAALEDKVFLNKTLRHVKDEKKYLYGAFKKMGLNYVPSATNFVLVDTGMNSKDVFEGLLKKGVIVRDMRPWGFSTYIRVTIGTHQENELFVKALKEEILL